MEGLFLKLLNTGLTATWLFLAVLVVRWVFRKAPRWIFCLLWGLVALRLICPFTFESRLSLVPSAEPFPPTVVTQAPMEDLSGVQEDSPSLPAPTVPDESQTETPDSSRKLLRICARIWAAGVVVMLAYSVISYFLLKHRVATATLLRDHIRQSERVTSPFVLGWLRPVIYLPYSLNEEDMRYVIAHEQTHIRRKDHWWKPIGFLILSVYWFHPGVWLGYILLCRDIEGACDEKVIASMTQEERRGYSAALFHCSVHRKYIAACPVAFGETNVKRRIQKIMSYRRPAFWVILLTMVAVVVVSVCFLTNPKTHDAEAFEGYWLCVEMESFQGTLGTPDRQGYQRFPVELCEEQSLNGSVGVQFSIVEVDVDTVTLSFAQPLLLDGEEITRLKLKKEEQVRLTTPTTGGSTVYTFGLLPEQTHTRQWLLSLLDEIAHNPDAAMHSNPYEYIAQSPEAYEELLSYGNQTVDCFVSELRQAKQYGLREYLMAAVCAELTGVGVKEGEYDTSWWETAGQWLMLYEQSLSPEQPKTRLAPGVYIPVRCAYMNPLSSYYPFDLAESLRYVVTEESLITENVSAGTSVNREVTWEWESTRVKPGEGSAPVLEQLPAVIHPNLSFLEETAYYDISMKDGAVYQIVGDSELLLKSDGSLYLIHRGPDPAHDLTKIWYVYILVHENEASSEMQEYPTAS